MPAGPVNRTLLESYYQNPGQIYDDTMTEGAFGVLADQMDQNYYQVANLINSGTVSPYLNNALAQAVINGGFKINQRGKTGTVVLSAGAYCFDRWKAGGGGCTFTFATVNNVTTITISSGSLQQVIEGSNIYSGNYILTWTGTSQGKINSNSYGSSGVTALLTGGNNTIIEFNPGTFTNVQFNYGTVALPFQPRSIGEELALCQRYYYKSYDNTPTAVGTVSGIATASSILSPHLRFPVPMRTQPTVIFSNNNVNNQVRRTSDNTAIPLTGVNIAFNSRGLAYITCSGTPLTAGQAYDFDIAADAEI